MQTELFSYLKERPEYQQFKKKCQTRSIVALAIISVFWFIIIAATDLDNIDGASMFYFGALFLATIFLLRYAYRAFFKRPEIVMQGTITDLRKIERTVNEERGLQTRTSYQYLVHGDDSNDYWGDCVYDFIEGCSRKHNIGERVIFFSMSPKNSYIIKLNHE